MVGRRKTDCYITDDPRGLTVTDLMETRVTGYNSRFPTDRDTTDRLNNLTFDVEDTRPSILMPLIGIMLIVAGVYGLFLIVVSK